MFLDSYSSKLGVGAGDHGIDQVEVLSSEGALIPQYPLVEHLIQWEIKLEGQEKGAECYFGTMILMV